MCFRAHTRDFALRLGLVGYARNLPRRVEVVDEGEEEKFQELVRFWHRGPPQAEVAGVEARWGAHREIPGPFGALTKRSCQRNAPAPSSFLLHGLEGVDPADGRGESRGGVYRGLDPGAHIGVGPPWVAGKHERRHPTNVGRGH